MAYQLVTRSGCHLCEEAETTLSELGIGFVAVDVDGDDELLRLYDFRVPVLLSGDRVVVEGRIDRERLRAALGR